MSRNIEYAHVVAFNDALSFFVGKTVQVLAVESGVPESIMRRLCRNGLAAGMLQRKGNRYRIDNAAPWKG